MPGVPAPAPAPAPGAPAEGPHCGCHNAWQAVRAEYPGGKIRWGQFETIWSMAWGQEGSVGKPGGPKAWQMAFAVIDASRDGYITEDEFKAACAKGVPGPGPAPAPVAMPKFGGKYLDVVPHTGPSPAEAPSPPLKDVIDVEPIIEPCKIKKGDKWVPAPSPPLGDH